MNIKINGKDVKLEYTFNSFKYMEDFDINEMKDIETKPFKMVKMTETLLLGALNNNPKNVYTLEDVETFLEEYVIENSISKFIEELIGLLQDSNFFKSLQNQ